FADRADHASGDENVLRAFHGFAPPRAATRAHQPWTAPEADAIRCENIRYPAHARVPVVDAPVPTVKHHRLRATLMKCPCDNLCTGLDIRKSKHACQRESQ